jgi:hypothetical protein
MKKLHGIHSFLIALILTMLMSTHSAAAELGEYDIKAGMVYNFILFVEWPPESFGKGRFLEICLAGDSQAGRSFTRLNGKPYKDKTINVRQVKGPGSIGGCNLLFIQNSENNLLQQYLLVARKRAVVTVSDIDSFAVNGGMIGFYEQGGKIRFEINLEAARQAKITIYSQLLKLARIVSGEKQ